MLPCLYQLKESLHLWQVHMTQFPKCWIKKQESLALASMAQDDPPASSTPPSAASSTAAAMRGKVGSEFETPISYNVPMHFHHRQTERQTDTDIVA